MVVKVLSYDRTSLSAKAIARFQRGKNRIFPNKNYRPKSDHLVVNWGFRGNISAFDYEALGDSFLNKPRNIALASDKIRCLETLSRNDVKTLGFTTNRDEAEQFLRENGGKVYCRTLISSHSGKGIVIAEEPEEIVDARLYTYEFVNDIEFRVHIFKGEITDIQQKRRMSRERRERMGIDGVVDGVRNLKNGYSFTRGNLTLRNGDGEFIEDLFRVPLDAVEALGLDFAAVDLLYNSETDEAIVCEVNTAPGMKVGTTTHFRYIESIQNYAGNRFDLEIYNNRYGIDFQNEHEGNLDEFINFFK